MTDKGKRNTRSDRSERGERRDWGERTERSVPKFEATPATPDKRHDKIQEAVQHLAGEFIVRESGPQSLITVTRVILSDDNKHAKIFLSVLPESEEKKALAFCIRERGEMYLYIRSKIRVHPIPQLDFMIDDGEKNRQRIDELTRN